MVQEAAYNAEEKAIGKVIFAERDCPHCSYFPTAIYQPATFALSPTFVSVVCHAFV